jgi:hypothetical protein
MVLAVKSHQSSDGIWDVLTCSYQTFEPELQAFLSDVTEYARIDGDVT